MPRQNFNQLFRYIPKYRDSRQANGSFVLSPKDFWTVDLSASKSFKFLKSLFFRGEST